MTETSYLIRPTAVFKSSHLDALKEGFTVGKGTGCSLPMTVSDIGEINSDFTKYLGSLDRDGQTELELNGRRLSGTPSMTFWFVDGEEFIGAVDIRARINNEVLSNFGGHIGFGIRPSKRGCGYGKRQLGLALDIARGMGINTVRISCNEDNIPSRKIIEANGGQFFRKGQPTWYAKVPFLLYEIPLIEYRRIEPVRQHSRIEKQGLADAEKLRSYQL